MIPQYNTRILELLNYEGPVLTCEHCKNDDVVDDNTYYIIKDQFSNILNVISYEQLISFFEGEYTIVDSAGVPWNYLNESIDAKPSIDDINLFLYSNDAA